MSEKKKNNELTFALDNLERLGAEVVKTQEHTPESGEDVDKKFLRKLRSARFNALDVVNLQLKKQIEELGGRVPNDDRD